MLLPLLAALVVGYLLGSLPFGVWVARAHGVDIFKVGSGNPGATNVKRSIGKKAGNLVFFLDFLKGVAATIWPLLLDRLAGPDCACGVEQIERMAVAGMVGAIVGHSFSCFIGFRGGKGVATSLGGLLALSWPVALIGVGVWVVVFYTTRYVSLASILLAASLPLSSWLLHQTLFLTLFFCLLAVFIIVRHRTNIQRLLAGTESKFAKKKPDEAK
ncbi:MAG TPA: glycerol-3-phosphate 1-O-acyltransferase PlsY [Opitutaceae bacterium]|nr:glycerol-3-phosphate 1-O-acyltransferase PlsY [Opitutaceae bacterium]